MSQLKEILEKEKDRGSLEQCAVIHLFREGTFYRAYEWSAWLCLRYFTELKVTHRMLKGGEDIIFVGFPLTSIDRYTPEGAEVFPLSDKSIEMTLPTEAFAPDIEIESLRMDFENWKQCQPLTEASKKKVEEGRVEAQRNAHPRLTDIMLRILAYPIEQHSPMECMVFFGGHQATDFGDYLIQVSRIPMGCKRRRLLGVLPNVNPYGICWAQLIARHPIGMHVR